ncbi:MAG: acetate/propionate family kinase [Nocardioidaceae bacterium]
MAVLVVNAGSSSLKLRVLADDDAVTRSVDIDDWDGGTGVLGHLAGEERIHAVGHRVVHGGSLFTGPVVVDDDVEAQIESLTSLAPLHQPRALAGIRAARKELSGVPSVACFDTAFHADLPAAASTYALPGSWRRRWDLRRFGFHGLSHAYASRRAAALLDRPLADLRLVTCHLGAGASLCAVSGGRSVDTTMGFTPLEGLVMATRAGSVDPGLVLWLLGHTDLSIEQVNDALEHQSGLLGLSESTGDLQRLLQSEDAEAGLAISVYVHRLTSLVAAMTVSMGGLDAVTFTGGVGENSSQIRAIAAKRLAHLGLAIDMSLNDAAAGDVDISSPGSSVRVLVLQSREDLEIARLVRSVVTQDQPGARGDS